VSEPVQVLPEQTRDGRYRLLARLGRGGMADVFLAVSAGPKSFSKLVVVKRLLPQWTEDELFTRMFFDEARLALRLNHPNVVQTYEVTEDEGGHSIVMEYLEGQSLRRVTQAAHKAGTPLSIGESVRIMSDVLSGLHHAHELTGYDGKPLELVHRDVSPHNIIVTYDGTTKVVDFGVAKATLNTTHTAVGTMKGKPNYMSPEQLKDNPIDRRADVFTAGIVLWELLTGAKLFGSESLKAMQRVLSMSIPRVSTLVPTVTVELDDIAAKALERDPAKRFPTALAMQEALERYAISQGEMVSASALAKRMSELFRTSRDNVRAQIAQCMEGSDDVVGLAVSAALPSIGSQNGHARSASASIRSSSVPDYEASDPAPLPEATKGLRPHYGRVLVAVVAFVTVVGVGTWLWRRPVAAATASPVVQTPAASVGESRPGTRSVRIESSPVGAIVSWRGAPLGEAPVTVDLPLGLNLLTCSKEGFRDASISINVLGGDGAVVRTAKLEAVASPDAATPPVATRASAPAGGSNAAAKRSKEAAASSGSTTSLEVLLIEDEKPQDIDVRIIR